MTSRLGTGKLLTFFHSVGSVESMLGLLQSLKIRALGHKREGIGWEFENMHDKRDQKI
jgi:hypothetical protein